MANTRTETFGTSDPEGDLDYVPRGGVRPSKPKKLATGKYGLKAADRIDERENQAAIDRAKEWGSAPEEARLTSRDALHAIRVEKLGLPNGQTAVAPTVEVEPVAEPQYPIPKPGEQAKLF